MSGILALPSNTRLLANPNFVLREEEDESALLFDPDTGSVRILNSSAVAIWKLLDGKRDRAALISALTEQFDGIDEGAEAQIVQVLDNLFTCGAIGVVSD